jgi:Undecaprenyl-phosphate galactose phosphotransferase WbaP
MDASEISTQNITTSHSLDLKRIPFFERRARWWMGSVLVSADLFSLMISFVFAIWLRRHMIDNLITGFSTKSTDVKPILLQSNYLTLVPALLLFVVLYYLSGLYPGNGLNPAREMQRLTINTSFVYLGLAATSFMAKSTDEYSRMIFALSWFFSILLLPLMRFIFRTLAIDHFSWGEPVAIVGDNEDVKHLANHLKKNPGIGLKPAFLFYQDEGGDIEHENIPLIHETWLPVLCSENQIECILISAGQEHLAEKYQTSFKRVIVVKTDSLSQLIWVTVQDLYGLVGYEISVNLNNLGPQLIKRFMDIFVSLSGLILLTPIIGFLSLLIFLDSRGPAFFQQIRIGKAGKRFNFFKLRTMHPNADQLLEEHLAQDPIMKQEWDQFQKLRQDPRVTRVGKVLRRFSLDELPQLFNVLIGDMSLVGPRPFFPQQEEYYGDRLLLYKCVRPGLTGMWQISGKNEVSFHERTCLDEYYVRNWSIWLDIYILARTIPTVVFNREDY